MSAISHLSHLHSAMQPPRQAPVFSENRIPVRHDVQLHNVSTRSQVSPEIPQSYAHLRRSSQHRSQCVPATARRLYNHSPEMLTALLSSQYRGKLLPYIINPYSKSRMR